jgi:uncharacterized Zn-finger protein
VSEYSICSVHDIAEVVTSDAFQACPHCGHVFLSASDLVEAYNESEGAYAEDMDTEPIYITLGQVDSVDICPFCGRLWG